MNIFHITIVLEDSGDPPLTVREIKQQFAKFLTDTLELDIDSLHVKQVK